MAPTIAEEAVGELSCVMADAFALDDDEAGAGQDRNRKRAHHQGHEGRGFAHAGRPLEEKERTQRDVNDLRRRLHGDVGNHRGIGDGRCDPIEHCGARADDEPADMGKGQKLGGRFPHHPSPGENPEPGGAVTPGHDLPCAAQRDIERELVTDEDGHAG